MWFGSGFLPLVKFSSSMAVGVALLRYLSGF
jgi:hypothetical protein